MRQIGPFGRHVTYSGGPTEREKCIEMQRRKVGRMVPARGKGKKERGCKDENDQEK